MHKPKLSTPKKKRTKKKELKHQVRKSNPKWAKGSLNKDNIDLFLEIFPQVKKRFCDYYLLTFNAQESYSRVHKNDNKTTCKSNGYKLLRDGLCELYLDYKAREFNEQAAISRDQLMRDLSITKDRCMQKVPVMEKIDGVWVETGEWKFDATNVLKAVTMQGKEIGMFKDRVEVENIGGGTRQVYHYVVPEIKPIDIASDNVIKEVADQIEEYIIERRKKAERK